MALGAILEGDGQYKQAIKLYDRAVAVAGKDPGPNSLNLADCQHSLGRADFKNGQHAQAEQLYRSSLALIMQQKNLPSIKLMQDLISDYTDLLEKTYGQGKSLPSDVRTELLKDRLADLPQKQGIQSSSFEKEVTLRFAKDAFEKIPADSDTKNLPPAAPTVPIVEHSVGADSAAEEGIGQQRIAFYQRMIAVDIKTLGNEHPSVARI